ncbi:hypothetical protein [Streptococcus sp. zg-JUN1979]|uniref:DUF7679 family protein n=1 Tax=Streptococcus sp. zg-JUN1979 TaxID=3391450 RepID=UPI0039B066A0
MAKRKIYFYIEVEELNGHHRTLQLPRDLQAPMRQYFYQHRGSWQELLRGGLINIATEPYTEENHFQPTIRLAKICKFFYKDKEQEERSRGQFLVASNWKTKGIKHFWQSARFIQHDYPLKNKLILTIDYYRWRRRLS